MNYTIDSETIISVNEGKVSVRAELWAASVEDLPDYNSIKDRILVPGSIALIPSESKIYVLDFSNSWTEWSSKEE